MGFCAFYSPVCRVIHSESKYGGLLPSVGREWSAIVDSSPISDEKKRLGH
jgi:hypothetical protein